MATKTSSKSASSAPKRKRSTTPPPAKLAGATVLAPASGPATSASALKPVPSHEDIAFRAWELYQMRAASEGGALNDWLAAERELRAS
jgi:Protein of unknown function (DUF2934)